MSHDDILDIMNGYQPLMSAMLSARKQLKNIGLDSVFINIKEVL